MRNHAKLNLSKLESMPLPLETLLIYANAPMSIDASECNLQGKQENTNIARVFM